MKRLAISLAVLAFSICVFAAEKTSAGSGPIAVLTASDGVALDRLGSSAAMSGDTIYAANVTLQQGQPSAVYVFQKPPNGWTDMTESAKLTIPASNFGFYTEVNAVAASGDVVVASAFGEGPDGTGALYVFVKPPTGWTNMSPTATLVSTGNDRFGTNVAIDGDTIVAGDPGCTSGGDTGSGFAYIFQKPQGGWHDMSQTATLQPSDAQGCDDFGGSVGISGDTIVIGADRGGIQPPSSPGEIYIFVKPQGGWTNMTETAQLTASPNLVGNELGMSVAIGGNTVVARGIIQRNLGIFVFEKANGGWTSGNQSAILLGSGQGPLAVNAPGTVIASGTPFNLKSGRGTTRVYIEPQGGWQDTSKANHAFTGVGTSDSLGSAVTIGGTTLVVGAPGVTVNGNSAQGAVYVYGK